MFFSIRFGAGPTRDQASRGDGIVDVPQECADLKCSFRNVAPKHSAIIPMFPFSSAWWPSDGWTFAMEFVTDIRRMNWVTVLWSISPTRRNRQMRHTAVSQLNSRLFTKDTFTLSNCWKPLLHVSSSKPKPLLSNNFACASKIPCDMWHMWRDCSRLVI